MISLQVGFDEQLCSKIVRDAARSENTKLAYDKGWRCFSHWCESVDISPVDANPHDVASFFVSVGGIHRKGGQQALSLNTLRLYRSGLNDYWRKNGMESPAASKTVDDVLRGLARIRSEPPRRVKALRENQIVSMLNTCSEDIYSHRDAALLSLGFAAALRRSELCNLRIEDLERRGHEGLLIHIRHSKTDQGGMGQRVAVPEGRAIRPITRLDRWLQVSGITYGYLLQTLRRGGKPSGRRLDPGDVARVVKRYVARIGLEPSDYSGHSLRAGFVTSAAAHHARIDKIMEVTRHKSADMVMKYIRDEDSFVDHAGADFL